MKLSTECRGGVVFAKRASFASLTVSIQDPLSLVCNGRTSMECVPCPADFSSVFTVYPEIFRAIYTA